MVNPIRLGAVALGIACSGLGMYGAYEFALKLEGNTVTYIVLAAPVIAGAAAIIPVLAEATWRDGAYLKALLWWAVLVPAGAVVFFSAAERVHVAKAGAQAERDALRGAASRAQAALTKAEAELAKARAEANQRGPEAVRPACRTKLAAEASAQADVEAARRELLLAEKQGHSGQPSPGAGVAAPSGARPGGLHGDLDGTFGVREGAPRETARRRRHRAKGRRVASRLPSPRAASNANVVPFSAA